MPNPDSPLSEPSDRDTNFNRSTQLNNNPKHPNNIINLPVSISTSSSYGCSSSSCGATWRTRARARGRRGSARRGGGWCPCFRGFRVPCGRWGRRGRGWCPFVCWRRSGRSGFWFRASEPPVKDNSRQQVADEGMWKEEDVPIKVQLPHRNTRKFLKQTLSHINTACTTRRALNMK